VVSCALRAPGRECGLYPQDPRPQASDDNGKQAKDDNNNTKEPSLCVQEVEVQVDIENL
jgi:hypothetical protein